MSTQAATIEYASSVPILIMSINCWRSNIAARTPATFHLSFYVANWYNEDKARSRDVPVKSPAINVPISGVWNRELTFPIHTNIRPSEAMA